MELVEEKAIALVREKFNRFDPKIIAALEECVRRIQDLKDQLDKAHAQNPGETTR